MSFALHLDDATLDALADAVAGRLAPRFDPPERWPEWMSIPTAAAYLDCGEHRLRKLVQRQAIPHTRDTDGGRIFFEREALDEWMHTKTNERSTHDAHGHRAAPTGSGDVVE